MADADPTSADNSSATATYFVDRQRRITFWSQAAEQLTGFTAGEVAGRPCSDGILRHVGENGVLLCVHGCPLAAVVEDGVSRETSAYLHHAEGHRVPVDVRAEAVRGPDGEIVGAVEYFARRTVGGVPVTAHGSRPVAADVDEETGLRSRDAGQRTLEAILAAVEARIIGLGVVMVRVDDPDGEADPARRAPSAPPVSSDSAGRIRRMVGRDVSNALRTNDVAIDWGQGRFLALLPGATRDDLDIAAERMRMLVEQSWLDGPGGPLTVTVSVGSTAVQAGETATEVLERVATLVDASSAAGGNQVTSDIGPLPRGGVPMAADTSAMTAAQQARP